MREAKLGGVDSRNAAVVRSLVFHVSGFPPELDRLLGEFRLIVNESIRIALSHDIRSRYRLSAAAYGQLSAEHCIFKQYIPSAFEVAMGALKAHRRRLKKGRRSSTPYMTKLMLKAENQSYRLDRETGRLRIPVRRGEMAVVLHLTLSEWHRSILGDPSWRLGSLTVVPGKVIIAVRKDAPERYKPEAAIALDTNEDSLDGVFAEKDAAGLLTLSFGGVRQIQATHFRRRRRLARKKANDRRVQKMLLSREGKRERNRVRQRLHVVSKSLVKAAKEHRAAIVLEDLTLHSAGGRSRRMNRRLSSWPRREIHRQIEYKSALEGVPVIRVNPRYTSKTCPACGVRRRERVGRVFKCECGWSMDRQHNAGLNILKTALASDEALARAVRFQPGALRDDMVIPLYDLQALLEGAREESSGDEVDFVEAT